jgi:hypothetical protein
VPEQVEVGNRLQFGLQGPILRVVWFETFSDSLNRAPNKSPQVYANSYTKRDAPVKPESAAFAQPAGLPSNETATIEIIGENKPFPLTKNNVWLGRDTNCEIVMEASAVMVSRRHAEIKCEGNDYYVHDNASFNGTLVNNQRISAPTRLYHDDEIQLGMGGPVLRFNSPSRVAEGSESCRSAFGRFRTNRRLPGISREISRFRIKNDGGEC